MKNKHIKRVILLITLTLLLIGIANATDTQNTTKTTTDNIQPNTHNTITHDITKNPTDNNMQTQEKNKHINKKDNNNTKEDPTITTQIKYNKINSVTLGNPVKISGKLLNQKTGITGQNITIKVDDMEYIVKTGKNGTFSTTYTPTNNNKYYVSFNYLGNNNYKPSTNTTSFYVKKETEIILKEIEPANYASTITIDGNLLADGEGISGKKVTITIGETQYSTSTQTKGSFSIKHKINTYERQKITAQFKGDNYYKQSKSTNTINVKQETNIQIFAIRTTPYDENVKISGKLFSNSKGLKNQVIEITVGKDSYLTQTTKTGYFTINHTTNKVGTNTVKMEYTGEYNYRQTINTTTFEVKKQRTKIILNKIPKNKYNTNVTIKGKIVDKNNKKLSKVPITLKLNNAIRNIQTDENGNFKYSIKTKKLGTNTVKISYKGNTNYQPIEKQTTFKVVNKSTILKFSVSNVTYNDYTNITGYLVDKDYKNLKNTRLFIKLNGKTYKTVTDSEGDFMYSFYAKKSGINRVTVTFKGTELYSKSSITKVFKVYKKETRIYTNGIIAASLGDTVKITGELYDDDYNNLKYKPVTLKVNNEIFTIKTDKKGVFSYNYKTKKIGKNFIKVSYVGDKNYEKSSDSDDFYTAKAYTATLKTPVDSMDKLVLGDDIIYAWYKPKHGEGSSIGANLRIYNTKGEYMWDRGEHMLLNATFYFKNSKGNIITRKCRYGDSIIMYYDLIPGYAAYKVVFSYRKLTRIEKTKWDNGYTWDPVSQEWVYRTYD